MKKRIILVALSVLMAMPLFAQEKVAKQVERMVKRDNANLVEARQLMEPVLKNPETAESAYAWYVAGLVEEKAVEKGYLALQLGQQVDEQEFYKNLDAMITFYEKAALLDNQPNDKGRVRPKYTKKISESVSTYYPLLVNAGSAALDAQDFVNAHAYFGKYGQVKTWPIFEGTHVAEQDSMSMQIAFFDAYSASQIEGNEQGAIQAYERIKNMPYRQNDIYQLLSVSYLNVGDTVQYVKTLEEGAKLFPDEQYFLFNMINMYLRQGENDKAVAYLNQALEKEPRNEQLYLVLATVYEQGYQDVAKAEELFKKALEINPEYGDAVIGLGRVYYNQAVQIKSDANAITDATQYNIEENKAEELFKKALPFFERAVEIEPDNSEYQVALMGIYYNLGMEDKVAEVEKKMQGN